MRLKKIIKSISVVALITASCSLQSCLVAAIGSGIGAYKWGDAKKAEAETKCKKEYPNYYNSMEKINNTKRAHHEKTDPIMTLQEYCHIEPEEKPVAQKTEEKP